jgi:phosphatidylglycerophosphatase C
MAAFEGEYVDRVEAAGVAFARDVMRTNLRAGVVASLHDHLANGDTVILVSASFEVYLRPLATHLGAADVLGTRLADDDGRFTGRLDGPNCRGPEKVRRLHDWLDLHAGGRTNVHLTAYGDSSGDRELLIDADVPRWVGAGAMPSVWMASK